MSSMKPSLKKQQQDKILYNSKRVGQGIDDVLEAKTGEKVTKSFTFRNEGTQEWPKNTRLSHTNGANFFFTEQHINKVVQPGEQVEVLLSFIAPQKEGEYDSFFKLAYGNNTKFGQKLHQKIKVIEDKSDINKIFDLMGANEV